MGHHSRYSKYLLPHRIRHCFPWDENSLRSTVLATLKYTVQSTVFLTIVTCCILHPQDLLYNSKFIPFDHLRLFCPSLTFGNQQTLQDPQ